MRLIPIAGGVALALWFGTPGAAQRPAAARRDPLAGIDAYITQAMKIWKVPGLAISVVKGDSMIFAAGYGVRRIGEAARVDARTMFAIGSASKAFTGATVGMLVDEGKVGWDEPVATYLGSFEMYDPWATREIRVRDLLTHQSGLSRGDALWFGTTRSREEILRAVRMLKPSWSMRSKFGYQNLMFLAAGEVVHAVSGKSWDDFVAERIFRPLQMSESNSTVRALEGKPNVATPHAEIEDTVRVVAWRNIDNVAAAGSINSNVTEMANWVRLWLNGGAFRGVRILSEAVVKEATSPQFVIRDPFWQLVAGPDANFVTYGFGWAVQDFHGRKFVHHGGNIDGMSAMVGFMPQDKLGVVVLTNLNGTMSTMAVMQHVLDRMLGVTPPRDLSAWFREQVAPFERQEVEQRRKRTEARVAGTEPSLPLDQYAGKYTNDLYGGATVTVESGHLVVKYDASPAAVGDLHHWHFDVFEARMRDPMMGKIPVAFELGSNGKVARMTFELEGPVEWRREGAPVAAGR